MATDLPLSTSEHAPAGADPTLVLTLVVAHAPLPPETTCALRLVCRATKLAVDHSVKYLWLGYNALKGLRVNDNPLLSGLTSLLYDGNDCHKETIPIFYKAVRVAMNNKDTLESLDMVPWPADGPISLFRGRLRLLGSVEWPRLRSLMMYASSALPFLNLDNMPALTKLCLEGPLDPNDVAALSSAHRLLPRLERLQFLDINYDIHAPAEYYDSFKSLFQATTRLRRLEILDVGEASDGLTYLAADLPSLEYLKLDGIMMAVLDPLVSVQRPKLRTLSLRGFGVDTSPIVSTGSAALPALQHLVFNNLWSHDWNSLREMSLRTLKSLVFHLCNVEVENIADLAVGLNNLPSLEKLVLLLQRGYSNRAEKAMRLLMETIVSLPRLLRFETGGDWIDSDDSLGVLIEYAYKMPQLNSLVTEGRITADGFAALAEAGRQGRWHKMEYFKVSAVVDDVGDRVGEAASELCLSEVRAAWPGLEAVAAERDEDWQWVYLDSEEIELY